MIAPGSLEVRKVSYLEGLGETFEIANSDEQHWAGQALRKDYADLFSAAPDLYAALDEIASLWRLPECSNELVGRMIHERVMGPAITALAKARGEAA